MSDRVTLATAVEFHAEIARLRSALAAYTEGVLTDAKTKTMLTDAEREAVEQSIDAANGMAAAEPWTAATLRGLLERTQGGAATDASDAR